jgi:hypothetical protein
MKAVVGKKKKKKKRGTSMLSVGGEEGSKGEGAGAAESAGRGGEDCAGAGGDRSTKWKPTSSE